MNYNLGFMMTNRRNFLKNGAIAMGGAIFGSCAWIEEKKTEDNLFLTNEYTYPLPNFEKTSRILFQGDSITDMNRGRDEWDRNHYLGHSYVYLIAARLGVDMAKMDLDFYNRGISGHTVSDLRSRWKTDAIDLKPDLLSILVGTNDVEFGVKPEAYESDYHYILDASLKANPDLRIVLLEPFILQTGRLKDQKVWESRRAATDALGIIVAKLAKQYNAVLVKTQKIFDDAAAAVSPDHWIWDGIHPLPQGHELIARHWLEEVSNRWPLK